MKLLGQTLAPPSPPSLFNGDSVRAVHSAVAGRTRFFVEGLKSSPALKQWLETHVPGRGGIRSVVASTLTGTALVHHEPDRSLEEIALWLSPGAILPTPGVAPEVSGVPRAPFPEGVAWHALEVAEVLNRLGTHPNKGLLKAIARQKLKEEGRNVLDEVKRRSGLAIFASQFKTLPVGLLTGSAALSLCTGGMTEAVVILCVVIANAYIGYGTETLVENTLSLLSKMGPSRVPVIRGGKTMTVDTSELVVGDIIALVPGLYVPADGRLVRTERLTVDESALTGESLPVEKTATELPTGTPLAERRNMIYRGTIVTGGSALAVVTATGRATEIGRIQRLVAQAKPSETPLQAQMDRLGAQLVSASGVLAGGVFVAGCLRGYGALEMLKTSVSLAIAAVPEGLPTVATTTLSRTALAMRRRNVLVRNLHAVETLGAAEVICLDKTGTLTMNRMSVVSTVSGTRFTQPRFLESKLFEIASLCNEAVFTDSDPTGRPRLEGSPTEVALVEGALRQGIDVRALRAKLPRLKLEHRTEERSFMVTEHKTGGGVLLAVKGNPAQVLARCSHRLKGDKAVSLSAKARASILAANDKMGADALRVLGVAYAETDGEDKVESGKLVWLGLVGIADTARAGTADLVRRFHQAGIRTAMITGDQATTALAVARELGLAPKEEPKLVDFSEGDWDTRRVREAEVFARVSPADKLKIVQAMRDGGHIVAMAGDGINDAPALRAADIGIAMGGRGTEVARGVADVVLVDDDLAHLVQAIELGRATRDAIKKAVVFLLATNLSESFIVLGGVLSGKGQPLSPMQLLWINLVSDVFPALALAMEPPEADVLSRPPRDPKEPLLGRSDVKRIGKDATLMTATTLAAYAWGVGRYGAGAKAQTVAFTTLAGSQLLHTFSSRTTASLLGRPKLPSNRYVPLSVGLGFGLQALGIGVPIVRRMIGCEPLGLVDIGVCAAGAATNFFVNELTKRESR